MAEQQTESRPGGPAWSRAWGWLIGHARPVLAVYWVALVLGTHWPRLQVLPPPPTGPGRSPLYDVLSFDKVLHALGFGGLMVLLILAGPGGRGRGWVGRCGIALVIGLAFAAVDELTQGLMPERYVSAADLLTNFLAMIGVYLLAVLPAERDPTPRPRGLRVALWVALPGLAALALTPGVMTGLIGFKQSLFGAGPDDLHPWDHVLHGILSAGLSVIVIVVWPMASRRPRRAAFWALSALMLAGPGVEVAQHFTGRSVEKADAVAHAFGVLLAMMWWAARLSWSPSLRRPADEAASTPPTKPADPSAPQA